ncbi:MAG: hypothetical protein OXT09_22530 [Myxococcales bacterium]|nr:hypothetical protein [Myxococcales bacterium]
MADPDCPHIEGCEMYTLLKLSGTLKAWQSRYCCADYKECARFKLSADNRRVPINLMPNGAYLRSNDKP